MFECTHGEKQGVLRRVSAARDTAHAWTRCGMV